MLLQTCQVRKKSGMGNNANVSLVKVGRKRDCCIRNFDKVTSSTNLFPEIIRWRFVSLNGIKS